MTALALLSLGVAWSGTPASTPLLSEEPDRARWVADKLDEVPLEPVSITSLMADKALALSGDGALLSCGGEPVSKRELTSALDASEAALDGGEITEGTARLRDEARQLSCLSEPVDAALIARLYLLRARAALGRQQVEAATADLTVALRLKPDLVWSPAWGDQAAFEAAKAAPTPARAALRVIPADSPVSVDGAGGALDRGEIALASGPHLVQIGPESWLISVQPGGTARLVLPSRVSPQTLQLARGGEAELADLDALIAVAYPDGRSVLVHSGGHVVSGETGGLMAPLPIHPPGRTLMGSGTGLLVAGAVGSALSLTIGQGLWEACHEVEDIGGTTEPAACSADNEALFKTMRIVLPLSEIAAGAGLTILGRGFWKRQAGFRPLPAATEAP